MSVKTVAVSQVSRNEYDRLVHRGHAGAVPIIDGTPIVDRWRETHPEWRGRHWQFLADGNGVLRLRPLNVARAQRRSLAA